MSASEMIYDIFAGTVGGDPLWILAVSGLHNATEVINQLATKHPGAYFAFDSVHGSTVAQANTLDERLTA